MSVSTGPFQTGGTAVLGVATVRAAATAVAHGVPELARTGARHIAEIAAIGTALVAVGVAIIRGGRHLQLSAGADLD